MKVIPLGLQLLLLTVATTPLPFNHSQGSRGAMDYSNRLGFIKDIPLKAPSKISENINKESSENVQKFDKLLVSRLPDAPVHKVNKSPRLSMLKIKKAHEKRQRRDLLHGTKWNKTELTWKLLNDNNDGLTRDDVESTLLRAFLMWESVSNLKFRKVSGNSSKNIDIEVSFVEGHHNDPYPFDGKHHFEHSFPPLNNKGLSGDIHFNDAVKFTVNSTEGISLFRIAVHSIGRSIGLKSSNKKKSVLFLFLPKYNQDDVQLSEEDILGIQALYGVKPPLTTVATTPNLAHGSGKAVGYKDSTPHVPSLKVTTTPRFSMPNITKAHEEKKGRYELHGTKWNKNELTWKLLNDNNDGLTRDEVENTLMKAFSMWESVSNLKFRKLSVNSNKNIDIEVSFVEGYHNDSYPFDKKGQILSHSFYPSTNEGLSGDIHFNDALKFTVNSTKGQVSLLGVAVHNIGASIGLSHSNDKESIMHPLLEKNRYDFQLSDDDILGVQALYGKPRMSAL